MQDNFVFLIMERKGTKLYCWDFFGAISYCERNRQFLPVLQKRKNSNALSITITMCGNRRLYLCFILVVLRHKSPVNGKAMFGTTSTLSSQQGKQRVFWNRFFTRFISLQSIKAWNIREHFCKVHNGSVKEVLLLSLVICVMFALTSPINGIRFKIVDYDIATKWGKPLSSNIKGRSNYFKNRSNKLFITRAQRCW